MFLAIVLSAVITIAIMPAWIRLLRRDNIGQQVRADGPESHLVKQGTPTMGGAVMLLAIAVTTVVLGGWRPEMWLLLATTLLTGVLGLVDDASKVLKKNTLGLKPRAKLIGQFSLVVVFCLLAVNLCGVEPTVHIPFLVTFDLGILTTTIGGVQIPWLYLLFVLILIAGMSNAVNLTDGLDGLAAGVTLPVAVYFIVIGAISGNLPVVVFASALAGGLAAFLIFNFNPAKVFMGDTGSLFLGGAVAGLAFACDQPLILVLVGLIYVIETLSDILQVAYYKATKKPVLDENGNPVRDAKGNIKMQGKRIFKKAPIHHHFQLCGWGEKKIVFVFAGITVLMCILAYFGVAPRYL